MPHLLSDMPDQPGRSAGLDARRWLADHGDLLYAYALRRVGNPVTAEDLVQDTLLAALDSASSYDGRSSERTWLVGILRHKLLDHWRRRGRTEGALEHALEAQVAAMFTPDGKWAAAPRDLPQAPGQREELSADLRRCLGNLPPRLAEAFLVREKQNVGVERVAELLGITSANAAQLLHRARLALRGCLERRGDDSGRGS